MSVSRLVAPEPPRLLSLVVRPRSHRGPPRRAGGSAASPKAAVTRLRPAAPTAGDVRNARVAAEPHERGSRQGRPRRSCGGVWPWSPRPNQALHPTAGHRLVVQHLSSFRRRVSLTVRPSRHLRRPRREGGCGWLFPEAAVTSLRHAAPAAGEAPVARAAAKAREAKRWGWAVAGGQRGVGVARAPGPRQALQRTATHEAVVRPNRRVPPPLSWVVRPLGGCMDQRERKYLNPGRLLDVLTLIQVLGYGAEISRTTLQVCVDLQEVDEEKLPARRADRTLEAGGPVTPRVLPGVRQIGVAVARLTVHGPKGTGRAAIIPRGLT